jgi:hypothetical protein
LRSADAAASIEVLATDRFEVVVAVAVVVTAMAAAGSLRWLLIVVRASSMSPIASSASKSCGDSC